MNFPVSKGKNSVFKDLAVDSKRLIPCATTANLSDGDCANSSLLFCWEFRVRLTSLSTLICSSLHPGLFCDTWKLFLVLASVARQLGRLFPRSPFISSSKSSKNSAVVSSSSLSSCNFSFLRLASLAIVFRSRLLCCCGCLGQFLAILSFQLTHVGSIHSSFEQFWTCVDRSVNWKIGSMFCGCHVKTKQLQSTMAINYESQSVYLSFKKKTQDLPSY